MRRRVVAGMAVLLSLLLMLSCLNLLVGGASFTAREALQALMGDAGNPLASRVIFGIRLPRMLCALILGGALAVSGLLMQAYFDNPIAGPYVLGISSGARLAVCLLQVVCALHRVLPGNFDQILWAFAGAMGVTGFILLAGSRVRSPGFLIICGVMIGYLCQAGTDLVASFARDAQVAGLQAWNRGSFSGISMDQVGVCAAVVIPCFAASLFLVKPLSIYRLGEREAAALGVPMRLFRCALVGLAGLLAGTVAAFAGPVSFVGVAVPHLVRRLCGTTHPGVLLPACFLGGGTLCLLCDLLARTLAAPVELGLSSVTAVAGAPVILWILLGRQGGRE